MERNSEGDISANLDLNRHPALTPFEKVLADTARRREANLKRENALAFKESSKLKVSGLFDYNTRLHVVFCVLRYLSSLLFDWTATTAVTYCKPVRARTNITRGETMVMMCFFAPAVATETPLELVARKVVGDTKSWGMPRQSMFHQSLPHSRPSLDMVSIRCKSRSETLHVSRALFSTNVTSIAAFYLRCSG